LASRGPNALETSGNCGEPAPTAYGGELREFARLQPYSHETRSLRRLLRIVVSPVRVRPCYGHRHVAPRGRSEPLQNSRIARTGERLRRGDDVARIGGELPLTGPKGSPAPRARARRSRQEPPSSRRSDLLRRAPGRRGTTWLSPRPRARGAGSEAVDDRLLLRLRPDCLVEGELVRATAAAARLVRPEHRKKHPGTARRPAQVVLRFEQTRPLRLSLRGDQTAR
jgi:hypothetical protein